ncbi:MAG TPA: hypothetical protein VF015_14065 [Acidimicrobiales bacterium]
MRTEETEQQSIDQRPERGGLRTDEATRGTPGGPPGVAPATTRRRRWWALVAGMVIVVLAAVLGVVLLDDGNGDSRDGGTAATEPETEATPETTAAPGTTDAVTPAPTAAPTPSEASVLADGRHPVFLTGLDVEGRTMEFDVIQWLTGEEAREAYTADHPDDPGYPPNDYYIVNDNPRLRVLPVVGGVTVTVLEHGFEPMDIAFEELPAFVADDLFPDDTSLWHNPFWLTVQDDVITDIEEQYTP